MGLNGDSGVWDSTNATTQEGDPMNWEARAALFSVAAVMLIATVWCVVNALQNSDTEKRFWLWGSPWCGLTAVVFGALGLTP